MNGAEKTLTGMAEFVPRRRVLLHALALVGAATGLAACKHLPAGAGPVGSREKESTSDRDAGGGDDGGGGGGY